GRGQERGGGVPGIPVAGIDSVQLLQRRVDRRRGLEVLIGGRLGGEERLDLGREGRIDAEEVPGGGVRLAAVRVDEEGGRGADGEGAGGAGGAVGVGVGAAGGGDRCLGVQAFRRSGVRCSVFRRCLGASARAMTSRSKSTSRSTSTSRTSGWDDAGGACSSRE